MTGNNNLRTKFAHLFFCQTPYIYEKKKITVYIHYITRWRKKLSEKNVTLVLGSN